MGIVGGCTQKVLLDETAKNKPLFGLRKLNGWQRRRLPNFGDC
jgi:hypothetical protein